MSHHSELIEKDIHSYLDQHEKKELLRFITCGSVDDGKSTLIGRLLLDSKMIYEDQLAKIKQESVTQGTTGGGFDPALLTDGLKAEREQGITIDVAYRYFSTAKRKFIIADTPGHIQYTRNMATGASTADLAIILVDARHGIVEQTKRHSFIVSLLGIKHVLVAINKMDLVDFDQQVFENIRNDYRSFAAKLDIPDTHFIPISALLGDNVVTSSENTPWYGGPTLMNFLETVYIGSDRNYQDFRFPVQYVNRPNLDFRGFCGTVASGTIRKGDSVMVLPSRKTSKVKDIVSFEGSMEEAFTPLSVTLTLEDEIDCSRGDVIVRPGNTGHVQQSLDAMVVWMHEQPMVPGKNYLIKHATTTVTGQIQTLRYQIDVNTLNRLDRPTLGLNEIGRCTIQLEKPLAFDDYRRNRNTGAFIIVDRISNATVGSGMIQLRKTDQDRPDHWEDTSALSGEGKANLVTPEQRENRYGQKPATILFTGKPSSGKTSLALEVERTLFGQGRTVSHLDGHTLREGISKDLGFAMADRSENLRRAAEIAKLINGSGLICLVSMVAPEEAIRKKAQELVGEDKFFVVHLQNQLQVADDSKTVNYETPENPDLELNLQETSLQEACQKVIAFLAEKKIIPSEI